MDKIEIEFTENELQTILFGLGELKAKDSMELILKIKETHATWKANKNCSTRKATRRGK